MHHINLKTHIMNEKLETYIEQKHLNIESTQEWISVKDFLPLNSWKIGGEIGLKGDHAGRFLCIVERHSKVGDLGHKENFIFHCVELCYWNDLAMKFQDSDNEWVIVTHWTQIPQIPNILITSKT